MLVSAVLCASVSRPDPPRSHTSLVMMLFVMSGGEEALSAPGGKEKGVLEDKMLGEMLVIN